MSLFTVEQLELIRRLKSTGINADAIVEAFRTLDDIERELEQAKQQSQAIAALMGPHGALSLGGGGGVSETGSMSGGLTGSTTSTTPTSLPPPPQTPTSMTVPSVVATPTLSQPPSVTTSESTSTHSPILLQHLRAQNPVPVTISASSPALCPTSPDRISVQTVPLASTASESALFQYESPSSGGSCRPIRSLRTPMKEITTLDDPGELDDFMRQGEEGCINDMKQFITQYSLRQTTVAMMTGVSQPYISKLLNGNHRELSLRCRKNIYSWYLNCRRHPEKLAAFLADPSTRLETNGDGELVPQRRERYVFRPILIRMLEQFFAQTPFPDLNRRIEIATACNHALQLDKKGVGLMPKEVVSPQVVANWFANKRKELRRKSNEEQQNTPNAPFAVAFVGQNPPSRGDSAPRIGTPHELMGYSDADSTPSPLPDENSGDSDSRNTTFDIASLAARLGFQFPTVSLGFPLSTPAGLPSDSMEIPPPVTIASLASQLFSGFPIPIQPPETGSSPPVLPATTSAPSLTPTMRMDTTMGPAVAAQEELLSQLYQGTLHQQLLKMEQKVE